MKKTVQKRDDGRYIIFYTFEPEQEERPCPNCGGTRNSNNG